MTATDSSQLEPDLHHPETGSTQHSTDAPHSPEPGAESMESAVPVKASPPEVDETSDSSERPRATRVAEGAWLGGVCTGLARHLGWPLMAVRVAFVALATFQFIGVIAYGALWLLLPPESTVKAPGLESAGRAGMRDQSKPKRRIDWGML